MASGSPIPWKTKHLVNLEFSGTLRVPRDPSDSLENKAFGDPGTPKGLARDLQGPLGIPPGPQGTIWIHWKTKHLVILGLLRGLPGTSRDLQGP